MATDVRLDTGDGTFLELEARVVKAIGSDFMLDSPDRHTGGGPHRRALVHDQNDGLTINFSGDYPGGVTIDGVAEIIPKRQVGLFQPLPTLVVRGGISYEVKGFAPVGGGVPRITVNLNDELNKLRSEIAELTARVAALEARQ